MRMRITDARVRLSEAIAENQGRIYIYTCVDSPEGSLYTLDFIAET